MKRFGKFQLVGFLFIFGMPCIGSASTQAVVADEASSSAFFSLGPLPIILGLVCLALWAVPSSKS